MSTPSPRDEIDRVGANYRKAGAANYITIDVDGSLVRLTGPPREQPRRTWRGETSDLLELLASLPDEAGTEAVWRPLSN